MGTLSAPAGVHGSEEDLSVFPESLRGKRILLCSESFGPVNGVSRTTLMLVNHLRANGAVVAVVAPHNHTQHNTFVPKPDDPQEEAAASSSSSSGVQNLEVRIHGYPLPYNPELSIVYPVRLSSLYRQTFGSPPDLIYLASPASLGFQVMLQLRQQPRESQVPIICNFQTDLAGYCAILFPPPFGDLAVAAFSRVQSFLFQHPSVRTLFYPSRFVRRYLEKSGVGAGKLELLQRGVDTALFHPARRSEALRRALAPSGEIILICVARLAGEKGFDFLAAAARSLDARGLAFRLYIVGGNRNAAVEAEIKDSFAPLAARGKVVFAGFQVGELLAAAYASADVFLHASTTETFGLVVLESMASGVPVVARDEGGPSDTVRHGETGFLTPPDDLAAFVDKVVLLAADPALRERLGQNARRQAEGATWERINNKVARRMADVIEERERERVLTESAQRLSKVQGHGASPSSADFANVTSVFGWLLQNDATRARIVDARLAGGIAVISVSWVVVGVYLVFIKAGIWVKAQVLRSGIKF
ncbi:glycosyltransferase family 4 protein [Lasiosphaeria miniovina]|uniref:Glycosyltransferase family 4 protein n=1 Tax=Lasiosphaeria miniovina TaxID=1954250 RepID=A0AA40E471_9PEZI|nr:glycosyltransferase family 4 protein [Lasiosphaeria miniovina]KAK0723411.1 glycosyltransferase family 4 protein [Lasiosphaeria miniovina]